MTPIFRAAILLTATGLASAALLHAQRGGGEWTTKGFDAQRTAWVRADGRLTKAAVEKGGFKFLWKQKFDNEARQLNSLTEPVLLDLLIGYRGFKTLAFVGGSADRVFSIDTDLGRPYWTAHLNYSAATGGQPPSSWACPGGLMAAASRRTALAPSTFGRGGGGGRGARSGRAVGEPGRGAAILSQAPPAGRGPAPPPPQPQAARGRAVAPVPFGGVDPLYVMGSDGFLHTLRVSNGADANPPVPFLPPSAKASALIFVDGMVYTTTSSDCGGAPNAVWALDVTTPDAKVVTWKTGGPDIAGSSGPAFGTDGAVVYVATRGGSGQYANAVVALDRGSLEPKDWFSAPGAEFSTSPTVVRFKDQDLVAVTADDGRLYLLDGASLGGADHKTPLFVTPKYTAAAVGASLATWEDQGTRWILAPAVGAPPAGAKFTANGVAPNGRVVAFKVVDASGKPALEPGWASRDLTSPLAPVVVNGLAFVVSSGESRSAGATLTAAQRAERSLPAVLYALDASTGKELWNSAKTITSFARAGLAAGGGQVYLVTYDNTLYAFGIPMEH